MKISIISTLAALALGVGTSMTALPVQASATAATEWWIVTCFNKNGGIIFLQDYNNYSDATQAANYCTSINGSWHITHV